MIGDYVCDYTIPSDNRELQPKIFRKLSLRHYTIPSDNRELQRKFAFWIFDVIIPYQVITGNYSDVAYISGGATIIPYQVITGNYSVRTVEANTDFIIPYQVITGNYSRNMPSKKR